MATLQEIFQKRDSEKKREREIPSQKIPVQKNETENSATRISCDEEFQIWRPSDEHEFGTEPCSTIFEEFDIVSPEEFPPCPKCGGYRLWQPLVDIEDGLPVSPRWKCVVCDGPPNTAARKRMERLKASSGM